MVVFRSLGTAWWGIVAMVMTVVLWATFALTLRGIGVSSLTPIDGAILRFGVPAIILVPLYRRTANALRRERWAVIVLLLAGTLPHYLLAALGGQLAQAALVGVLLPGAPPLIVAVLLFLFSGERLSASRILSLGVTAAGIAAAAVVTAGTSELQGIGLLCGAGGMWALYTIGLRRTRLDPVSIIITTCVPAFVVALGLAGSGMMPSSIFAGTARWDDTLAYVLLQGLGTGVLSSFAYAYAVRSLGSTTAATAGALSPVLTAGLAYPLLHETVSAASLVALALVTVGVIAFNLAPPISRPLRTRASSLHDNGPEQ